MENILSFVNKPLTGKEIKDWIDYHLCHQTEYTAMAQRMERFKNIDNSRLYKIVLSPPGTGCGETRRYHPIVVNACFGEER